jgi:hypothetical protein
MRYVINCCRIREWSPSNVVRKVLKLEGMLFIRASFASSSLVTIHEEVSRAIMV